MTARAKHILIIKLGALGDVILATTIIKAIVDHHASASITLLTTPPYVPLFQAWPELQVRAIARKGLSANLRAWWFIRGGGFDRAYDLQGNDRTRAMLALSGIAERVGNRRAWAYTHFPMPLVVSLHVFPRLQALLAAGRVAAAQPLPYLPASGSDVEQVRTWLAQHEISDGGFVIMHAGASRLWPGKRWPHYAGLAQALRTQGLQTIWIGAGEDAATNVALGKITGIDATGVFSLPALAELGRHARFAVTNDSGPMHVLSASGIAVFALFGPTDWRRSHALGQAENVLTPASGSKLADISVAAVLSKIRERGLLPTR